MLEINQIRNRAVLFLRLLNDWLDAEERRVGAKPLPVDHGADIGVSVDPDDRLPRSAEDPGQRRAWRYAAGAAALVVATFLLLLFVPGARA